MRVFLDANILFSAARTDGAIRRLLQLMRDAGHTLCVDDYVVTEARRNLERKGASSLSALDELLRSMRVAAAMFPVGEWADAVDWLPVKDRPVLVSAIRLHCDVLLTGDRADFGPGFGRAFGGVTLHSPRSLFEQLFPVP